MSGIEEFTRAVEEFTASDKERELRASRDSFRDGYERLQAELESARFTIRELQKRIGELEAERDDARIRAQNLFEQKVHLEQALTAERQRREELEHIATLTCDLDKPFGRAAVEQARVRYFSRHPSSSGNEPGNGRSE